VGLRSLAPREAEYVPRFRGGPLERDGAYHQGTVWSWLLGPFALAHYAVHGDASHALGLLAASAAHLNDACVGQVSEVFDGDAPFNPSGCPAQAWGVAETLRAHDQLTRKKNHG
jgi:glycogen debranching enzyme